MRSLPPKRRFPKKHISRKEPESNRFSLTTWFSRGIWLVVGGLLSLLVTFLSQGPEAIRKIPEIPKAVAETVNSVVEAHQIDRDLTGVWGVLPTNQSLAKNKVGSINLQITSDGNQIFGEIYSPVVRKWTIYDMALVEGRRTGDKLHLTIYDFVYGKKTRFAELEVQFQENDEGIMDHFPELVDSQLRIEITWQKGNVFPKNFLLDRISKQ